MGETKTTLTWLLRDEVSPTAAKINHELDKAGATAEKHTGTLGNLGGALGALVSPAGLALGAIGAVTAGIGLAIAKANEHDVVSKRLDATLAANVVGWTGNRTALDAYISKQTDAGFTVDETTASLAQLVTATGNVQKAQEFQSAAEDLARLKGISLADATDAMTKVEAGRFKGLANLGIVLQKGATATDALRAVQKVAAGQSEAYGKTTAGAMAKINSKLDDAVTKIGDAFLPVVTSLAGFFADTLIPAIEDVANTLGPVLGPAIDIAGKAFGWFMDNVLGPAIKTVGTFLGWVKDALKFLGILNDQPVPAAQTGGLGPSAEHRAAGGPVEPGHVYTVGENGPEQLIMGSSSGRIIPNGVGGGGMVPAVIPIMLDGREVARVVDKRLFYALRTASPAIG